MNGKYRPIKVGELITALQELDPNLGVFLPGSGSSEGSWVPLLDPPREIKIVPSFIRHELYKVKADQAYEFQPVGDASAEDEAADERTWNDQHGFLAVLMD